MSVDCQFTYINVVISLYVKNNRDFLVAVFSLVTLL